MFVSRRHFKEILLDCKNLFSFTDLFQNTNLIQTKYIHIQSFYIKNDNPMILDVDASAAQTVLADKARKMFK